MQAATRIVALQPGHSTADESRWNMRILTLPATAISKNDRGFLVRGRMPHERVICNNNLWSRLWTIMNGRATDLSARLRGPCHDECCAQGPLDTPRQRAADHRGRALPGLARARTGPQIPRL